MNPTIQDHLQSKGLTPRQIEVSILVATNPARAQDIANILFVNLKTVRYHLTNVYKKLGIKSRAQLVVLVGNWPKDS